MLSAAINTVLSVVEFDRFVGTTTQFYVEFISFSLAFITISKLTFNIAKFHAKKIKFIRFSCFFIHSTTSVNKYARTHARSLARSHACASTGIVFTASIQSVCNVHCACEHSAASCCLTKIADGVSQIIQRTNRNITVKKNTHSCFAMKKTLANPPRLVFKQLNGFQAIDEQGKIKTILFLNASREVVTLIGKIFHPVCLLL